ncbi:hypothetical protein [Corynebacterium uterequi]|uniref:Uncharacterized protein n=1 Tax=Corynebacterium uterequi TaxID=1072256 RepID=A0A0G3HD43_9CORY|nr:hypothetical protein [Corynebacterium uterequi]AKK11291.1 hypothetical protein CUTER_06510 [Corynebacterium uterequi]
MSTDLLSIGLGFERWQDAVEAAIATNQLSVLGEVRGGQLIHYADPSGALITIMAVEPYATFAGFESVSQTFGNVTMVNDVVAYCEVIDAHGSVMQGVTVNLVHGPLLAELPTQEWQQLAVAALMIDYTLYPSSEDFAAAGLGAVGEFDSPGARIVASGDGSQVPDAAATFSARVLDSEYRHNQLSGQRFIHATVDGAFPFDVCLPDAPELPVRDSIIYGSAVMTAAVTSPTGGCGGCGGSCGCGGH